MKSTDLLKKKSIWFRLISLSDKALTVQDVMKYSKGDVKPDEICKTIIVKDEQDNFHALFLLGSDRIDFGKVRTAIGKVRIASPEEVKNVSGVEAGAVCPLLLAIPTIIDKKVFSKEKINFGSGDHLNGIEMKTEDLDKVIKFDVEEISQ